ncbi:hypothetical protein F0U60_41300 [Archangium minus]|uniref:Lipoprotein MlpA n=1 Tax=Archangium minus TaxID=83450 RepID=A0ABY9X364_9BACT|nr:hypothetical protein F0U61_41390 [Archangium violaceum]WNG49843.1 hypothetical protein F0U60_41300 [Archangium minus]
MTRRILGLAWAVALLSACDSSQPPIGCPVQSLDWSAVYIPKEPTTCPVIAGEMLGIQKFSSRTGDERLSINPESLVNLNERDSSQPSYSLGTLAREADEEGFCSASEMAVARKNVPDSKEGPATNISYQWSNVRILAIAQAPGTQMVAELERTENGCTVKYEVWAMWPGDVACGNEADQPDDSVCQNELSINPDFAVTCHPTLLRCVPAKRPPSLK